MIATVLGLGIAIPLLFGNALLTSLSRVSCRCSTSRAPGCSPSSIEKRNA